MPGFLLDCDFKLFASPLANHSEALVDGGIKPPTWNSFFCSRRIIYSTKLLELPNHDSHIRLHSLVGIESDKLNFYTHKNVKQNWNSEIRSLHKKEGVSHERDVKVRRV